MSEKCPYFSERKASNECHLKKGVIEIAGQPCENERGNEMCGKLAAYHYANEIRESYLDPLDIYCPISARLTIDKVPEGKSPLNIREELVGVSLPLRRLGEDSDSQGMIVTVPDMLLSLLSSGKLDAAEYYALDSTSNNNPYWIFDKNDGEVNKLELPMSSFDYYGIQIDDPEILRKMNKLSDDGSKL